MLKTNKAICVFHGKNVKGIVRFTPLNTGRVLVDVDLHGLEEGLHGFHVHKNGDLSEKNCSGGCEHFNPYNKVHGGRESKQRHVGDLGNIYANHKGDAKVSFEDSKISLSYTSKACILGRMLIIHAKEDDLGRYNGTSESKRKSSLVTGNAGKRIACGLIGIIEP